METFSNGVLNAPKLRALHVKKQGECH